MYKKVFSFVLILIITLSCALTADAANPTTFYKYTIQNGEVTLTYAETSKDVLNIPSEIEGLPVTGIDSDLFLNLVKLGSFEAINIPATVTDIETPIIFDKASVKAFNVDKNNPTYTSENGVIFNKEKTEILSYPNEKEDVTYVLPEGVVKITDSAFKSADFQYIELPDTLKIIGDNAFYRCGYLKELNLPKNVEHIGRDALLLNYGLTKVEVDAESKHFSSNNGVLFNKDKTSILYYPVAKTAESYKVPESVEVIGYRAFQGLSPLTAVILPEGLKRIEERGFCGCRKITELNIPSTVEYIGYEAFLNIGITDVIIPQGVREISDRAFRGSDLLTTVTLPDTVISIGEEAFAWNGSLEEINLPEGLEIIKIGAFTGCSSMDEIKIPASVTQIGADAFKDCGACLKIYGFKGSVAETTANEYGCKFVAVDDAYSENIAGDVNLDGKLNVRDATLLQKHLAKIASLGTKALGLADFDQNGKVNIRDATAIQKKISGLI